MKIRNCKAGACSWHTHIVVLSMVYGVLMTQLWFYAGNYPEVNKIRYVLFFGGNQVSVLFGNQREVA